MVKYEKMNKRENCLKMLLKGFTAKINPHRDPPRGEGGGFIHSL